MTDPRHVSREEFFRRLTNIDINQMNKHESEQRSIDLDMQQRMSAMADKKLERDKERRALDLEDKRANAALAILTELIRTRPVTADVKALAEEAAEAAKRICP